MEEHDMDLKRLITHHGIKHKQIAEALGISPGHWSKIINEKLPIPKKLVEPSSGKCWIVCKLAAMPCSQCRGADGWHKYFELQSIFLVYWKAWWNQWRKGEVRPLWRVANLKTRLENL